ncbi:MAG TPA: DUF721 domain-containing protein [Gammaproteobacteria bacterium]|nr:DUF721 domain-containing protein [Gammaproteobacteria bacterium]
MKINKLLGTGPLAGLLGQARDLRKMEARLAAILPTPLDAHCHILSIRNSVLVLAADSPVWAARLRFHAPQLVEQLTPRDSVKCYTIHVRVRPPETSPPPQARIPVTGRPGRQGVAALQQAAQSVSDPELKTALLRLASRDPGR